MPGIATGRAGIEGKRPQDHLDMNAPGSDPGLLADIAGGAGVRGSASATARPRIKAGPLTCALFAIAVGAAVLAGWLFDVPLLKSLVPGFVTMKANTALAFVLAGGSLLLQSSSPVSLARAQSGRALALAVALIGALTLAEYIFGWQLGIDELLFKVHETAPVWTAAPGRMAASSAAAFFFLGLALLAIEWEPRRGLRPAELLALLVIVLSSIAAIEYAFGHAIAYPFFRHTRMALHTFMTFEIGRAHV